MFFGLDAAIMLCVFMAFLVIACIGQYKKGHRQWRRQIFVSMILTSCGILFLVLAEVVISLYKFDGYQIATWLSLIGMLLWSISLFFFDWVVDFILRGKISDNPGLIANSKARTCYQIIRVIPVAGVLFLMITEIFK